MFESAEIGHKISKAEWKREISGLREGLLDAQLDLLQAKKFPVIIQVAGVDGAGSGSFRWQRRPKRRTFSPI